MSIRKIMAEENGSLAATIFVAASTAI